MTTFDRREEAFENLFAHDEEMRFKATAHRNRDLAAWAAGLMAKTPDDTAVYKNAIVAFAVEHGGDDTLFTRVREDLEQAGQSVSLVRVRAEMDRLMVDAIAYVKSV